LFFQYKCPTCSEATGDELTEDYCKTLETTGNTICIFQNEACVEKSCTTINSEESSLDDDTCSQFHSTVTGENNACIASSDGKCVETNECNKVKAGASDELCKKLSTTDNEKMACFYDADTNNVIDLPDMPHPRQRHTMISIGDNKVFIIGGVDSNKVTLLDVEFEDYESYPSMKYTRKDACAAYVNERYLYVFMGIVDELKGVADNFEKLDIKEEGGSWKILPINNFCGYKMPRSYCACAYIKEDSCFYFFGGSFNSTSQGTVMKLTEDKYEVTKTRYTLPFNCVFDETCFLRPNELKNDYYLFTFKEHQLIHFNTNTFSTCLSICIILQTTFKSGNFFLIFSAAVFNSLTCNSLSSSTVVNPGRKVL